MRRFRTISFLLLLWGLAGIAAFVMQVRADPSDIGDAATARAFASMPVWIWLAYAVAVIAGTAGALALLLRRKLARALFALSLAGVVLQFGWTILGFGLLDYKGADALLFPAVIVAIALFALVFAQARVRDGTLR